MANNTQIFFDTFTATGSHAYTGNAYFNNSALRNPKFLEQAAEALATYLDAALNANSWLDYQVYRNNGSDEYWAEATVALGGPTASFTYDSYREQLTFNYSWAGESITADIDTDAGAGAEVAQLIRDYAEA